MSQFFFWHHFAVKHLHSCLLGGAQQILLDCFSDTLQDSLKIIPVSLYPVDVTWVYLLVAENTQPNRAELTNVGALFEKKLRGLPAGSKWIWRTVKTTKFSPVCTWETCVMCIYRSAYFRLVCSELISLVLLIGNFDLVIFFVHVWRPLKCGGPCSAEHVRTFFNPALQPKLHCYTREVPTSAVGISNPTRMECTRLEAFFIQPASRSSLTV